MKEDGFGGWDESNMDWQSWAVEKIFLVDTNRSHLLVDRLCICVFVYLCIAHLCIWAVEKIFWVETNRRHLLVDKPQPPTAKNVQTLEIQKISAPLSINSVWKIEHIESQKAFLGQIRLCSVSLGHFYHILNPASIPLGVKRTDTPGLLTDVKFVTSITCSTCVKLSPEI